MQETTSNYFHAYNEMQVATSYMQCTSMPTLRAYNSTPYIQLATKVSHVVLTKNLGLLP